MAEDKRKITLPQLDEIWKAATKQWGDPGLRHPAPDTRFEGLRHLLNDIESLFESEKEDDIFGTIGTSVSSKKRPVRKKKKQRRIFQEDDDEDEDEIPF